MGSDCAKNCTIAAIRNRERSRILSLAILLIGILPIVQLGLRGPENPCCHVEALARPGKATGVMMFFSQWHRGNPAVSCQPSVKPGRGETGVLARPANLSRLSS